MALNFLPARRRSSKRKVKVARLEAAMAPFTHTCKDRLEEESLQFYRSEP